MLYALTPKTLVKLFETFDAMFITTDPMIKLSKRMELNNFKFHINKKFLDQLLEFDTLVAELDEIQASVSSQDLIFVLIFVLINALPPHYKEKIADLITSDPTKYSSYIAVRTGLIAKFECDKAWGLIDGKDAKGAQEPSLDTALYGNQKDGGRNNGKNLRGKGDKKEARRVEDHVFQLRKDGPGLLSTCDQGGPRQAEGLQSQQNCGEHCEKRRREEMERIGPAKER